ncbi:MAG: AAA family ATPase [Meiothermus sp.]|uniref:AAA family ATPase n=1 Tax=Meiothermus sp. TaxID=1955249 RepID=UPI0025E88E07|nr:AAA family ATPase [Meiothermus sp.]MCS7059465.1 AAA family ATPase [Meiothermus sp.]MCS7193871.1 AAA family ATPase [Meiothermus sp.]MCX7739503.1 AAA family ATPase [Meiothermus sp.]MDW8090182.1 AAA family ATPase [Meiothermus sp.]MDW8481484.1 AAA family ATPase [Meiothermus sp.]
MRAALKALEETLRSVLFGQERVIRELLATAVAGGHALLEGLPGLGKTLLAKAFAEASGLSYRRIQFTPDLLPADVTGTEILEDGQFVFRPGPIFAQVVLADEVNRATPKTQSALLEAMQERGVTVGGVRHPLPEPFLVLATQNPLELEGTYPLPEAQLDRFTAKIAFSAPPRATWVRILSEEPQTPQAVPGLDLLVARAEAAQVVVSQPALEAIANTAQLSGEEKHLRMGLSPRGAKAWLGLARALAYLDGRAHVDWEDLRGSALPALSHRLLLTEEAQFEGLRVEQVIQDLLRRTMPK